MGSIKDMLITQVIQSGIKWMLSLLSPASALVKAVLAIVDVVKFFTQRASQVFDLVQAFVQSLTAIASGKVGQVASAIENALKRALPVLIGLLASVLGIGGLAGKVVGLVKKIQKRVTKAIEGLWFRIKKMGRKVLSKFGRGKKKKVKGKSVEKEGTHDWDDVRVPFEAADDNTHTLYFDTKGSNTVLMVASTPKTFEEFIGNITIKGNDERIKKAKSEAVKIAKSIDIRKKDKVDGNEDKRKKKERDIAQLTKKLSNHAGILFGIGEEGLPESEIKYLSKSIGGGKLGTGMRAKVLSRKNSSEGSAPKETNTVYEKLFSRLDGNGAFYVRGHLLNDNIGGPGTLKNLTPLSQKGNKNHLRVAEEPIKIAVLGGAVVDYILTVKYGRSVPEVSDAQLEAAGFESEKDKATVRKIRNNEKHVPKGLSLRSYYLKKKGGEFVRDKLLVNQSSILNPVNLLLDSYKINIERKEQVSIMNSSIEDLVNNTPFEIDHVKLLKLVLKKLSQDKTRISWNKILKMIKDNVSTGLYGKIEEIVKNRKEQLKNVKIK